MSQQRHLRHLKTRAAFTASFYFVGLSGQETPSLELILQRISISHPRNLQQFTLDAHAPAHLPITCVLQNDRRVYTNRSIARNAHNPIIHRIPNASLPSHHFKGSICWLDHFGPRTPNLVIHHLSHLRIECCCMRFVLKDLLQNTFRSIHVLRLRYRCISLCYLLKMFFKSRFVSHA